MYRIGIDLGGTNIVTGLVNEAMEIVDCVSVKTALPRSAESMVADMGKMVDELIEKNGIYASLLRAQQEMAVRGATIDNTDKKETETENLERDVEYEQD